MQRSKIFPCDDYMKNMWWSIQYYPTIKKNNYDNVN